MQLSIPAEEFNLTETLESGQVFGFSFSDHFYQGLLFNSEVKLKRENGNLLISSENHISEDQIRTYFDLNRDLSPIYQLLKNDLPVFPEDLKGLRIIRQDPWEALAAFIISSNNNIKRIKLIWNNLIRHFSTTHLHFPTALEISESSEDVLKQLGLGYRAPFLFKTAKKVAENPNWFREINEFDYESAKEKLMEFDGVGEKVADCVLLFGFQKFEAFPVDVWIHRIMKKLYFKNRSVKEKRILKFAQKKWSGLAGYVQQYLFHGARKGLF